MASPHISPVFVARVSRCRCGGLRNPMCQRHIGGEAGAVVVDTTSSRLQGAQTATASLSASEAEYWCDMRAKLSLKELLELNLKPSVESTAVTYCTEFHAFFQYFMLTRRVTTRSLKITKEIPEIQHSRRPRYDSTEDFWLKGVRQIAFVQVARAEEAIAASTAGMDMVGTGFRPETGDFANLIPETHFQFGLAWGRHASAEEALREAMQAMEAGAESI
jgi:hypothetical protein